MLCFLDRIVFIKGEYHNAFVCRTMNDKRLAVVYDPIKVALKILLQF